MQRHAALYADIKESRPATIVRSGGQKTLQCSKEMQQRTVKILGIISGPLIHQSDFIRLVDLVLVLFGI